MDKSTQSLEQALSRITERELSLNERYGHLVLMVVSLIFSVGLLSLLMSEPDLPARTRVAFWVMVVIGLAWVTFAIGVLLRRRPLLANREIIAGRMSVAFSALFTAGAMFAGYYIRSEPWTPAVGTGLTLTAIAVTLLVRAHVRRSKLRALRAQLEAEIAALGPSL